MTKIFVRFLLSVAFGLCASLAALAQSSGGKPNVVVLMSDERAGWTWAPTPGAEGPSATRLRTSIASPRRGRDVHELVRPGQLHGRPGVVQHRAHSIRSALSIVVAPGDENYLRKETPTIAEFFKKNGYSTYFSGKWHLGDKPDSYPIEHGYEDMKQFGAYYPGVYTYSYTNP